MEEYNNLKDYPFRSYDDFNKAFELVLSCEMYYYVLPELKDKIDTYIDENKAFTSIIEEISLYDMDYDNAVNNFIKVVINANNLCEEYIEIYENIIKFLVNKGGKITNYNFIKYNYETPNEKYKFEDEIINYQIRGKLIDICYKYGLNLETMIDWEDIIAKNQVDINNDINIHYGSSYKYNHHHCLSFLKMNSEVLKKIK